MTDRSTRRRALALLALVLLPVVAAPVGTVAAAVPAVAPNNSSANGTNTTATPTPTGNETQPQVGPDQLPAPLRIEQAPRFDNPVQQSTENGERVYTARGNWLELRLRGVDHSEVRRAAVSGESASITDKGDYWEFSAGHTDGTYPVVFTLKNGTRLTATLKVTQTNQVHVNRERYEEVQRDAANWTTWEQRIIALFGAQADIESQTQAAAEFLEFKAAPLAYVLQNPVGVLVMLTMRPSGLFITALIIASVYGMLSGVAKIANRWRRFSGDEASIDEKQDAIELSQLQASLEGEDLNNVFAHWIAQRWRDILGVDSTFQAFNVSVVPFLNRGMLEDRLTLMDYNGYRAKIDRATPDGGTTAAGDGPDAPAGPVEQVTIEQFDQLTPGETPDGYTRLTDLDEDVVAYIEREGHDAVQRFNPLVADDPRFDEAVNDDVDLDLNYSLEEISDELFDRESAGFSKREQAEQLGQLLAHVRQKPITDPDGNVRQLRYALNGLLRVFNIAGDREGVPMVRVAQEQVQWLLNVHREERDVDAALNETQFGDFDFESEFKNGNANGGPSDD